MTDPVLLSLKKRADAVVRNRDTEDAQLLLDAEREFSAELVLRLNSVAKTILEISGKIKMLPGGSLAARLESLGLSVVELTMITSQFTRVVRGDDS